MTITIQDVNAMKVNKELKKQLHDTLVYAQETATDLLGQDTHLHIKIGRGISLAGSTSYKKKDDRFVISLSKYFIEDKSFQFMDDVIRHELAHVYAGLGERHGAYWKKIAQEFGATPKACHSEVLIKRYKYIGICTECGEKTYTTRIPSSDRSCGVCDPYRFNTDYLIEYDNNPLYVQ